MDYGLLNAIGITVMAVFGLWAFQKSLSGRGKNAKGRKEGTK